MVGSSVKVNSVAVIRPVARSGAKAGQELVPIPCVPSSAICHWAGAERREESKSPLLLSPTQSAGNTEGPALLSRLAVAILVFFFFFFNSLLLYRCSNLTQSYKKNYVATALVSCLVHMADCGAAGAELPSSTSS